MSYPIRLLWPMLVALLCPSGLAQSDLRLPRNVLPRLYEINLLPILIEGNFTTEGSVSILLECMRPTNSIVLHSADIAFNASSVVVADEASDQLLDVLGVAENKTAEILTISLRSPLASGHFYRLSMPFTSILNDELRGFYRSSYTEGGQTKFMAVSQMQPTDARRAFPCFDEPNMKANFSIKLGRTESQKSTSNMPIKNASIPIDGRPGYFWDLFETSLPVSTYLVGMMVSDFTFIESPSGLSNTTFRIWARPEAISQAEYASRIGPRVLSFYEEYFQIPFPLPKQDMLALTQLSFGGMENWGMITYRETALLYDPLKSSESDKRRVVQVISHELAHQWFGDLVTMDWWSDLWLNEGFASYIEYLGSNHVEPDFDIMPIIVVDDLQDVFSVDALETSHPISVTVNDPNEINELFDRISYGKGASIIRMLNKFIGETSFRKGLTNYLNSRKYSNAVQDDLWAALTEQANADGVQLPVDVRTIMNTWTLKMGYPVVTVNRNYDTRTANVTQARFLLMTNSNSSDSTVYRWWVPLTYTTDFGGPHSSAWLPYDNESVSVSNVAAKDQWVIFNVDEVGYYRVNYDLTNWNLITAQLLSSFQQISLINRAQLLDDSLNIARIDAIPYSIPLGLSRYLADEREYIPWQSALNGFSYINLMFVREAGYDALKAYLTSILTPLYNNVTFSDKPGDAHKLIYTRVLAVKWACSLNIGDCVSNSANLYSTWMANPANSSVVPVNQKQTITCTAIANGGEEEWNFAFELYKATNVAAESTKLLYGMSCSQDPAILSKFLEMSLNSTSGVRRSDASSVFRNVASNPVGRRITFEFLRDRWAEMVSFFNTLSDLAKIVDSVSQGFNTQSEVDDLKKLQEDHANELGTAARAFTQSIERAQANVEWMSLNYQEVVDWLNDGKSSAAIPTVAPPVWFAAILSTLWVSTNRCAQF